MPEMKFKENGGVSPVDLSRGYEKQEDVSPYSGENIMNPAHIEQEREMEAMRKKYEWPDEKEPVNGPNGFLDRDIPAPYYRPQRSDDEDRG